MTLNFLKQKVKEGSLVYSDDEIWYNKYDHFIIKHKTTDRAKREKINVDITSE